MGACVRVGVGVSEGEGEGVGVGVGVRKKWVARLMGGVLLMTPQ